MISANELKELIKKGETVWVANYNNGIVESITLEPFESVNGNYVWYYETDDNCLLEMNKDCEVEYAWLLEHLYKTKEEAEFAVKYKNVPSNDTLNLPTWEEINNRDDKHKSYTFYKNGTEYVLYINNVKGKYKVMIWAYRGYQDWEVFRDVATEENYLIACDICLKFWKGEKI